MPNNGLLGLSLINRFKKRKIVTATGAVDLVVPPASSGFDANPKILNTALTGAAEATVVVQATNPKDVATTGSILIFRDGGGATASTYSGFTSTATTISFTITSNQDFSGAAGSATALASAGNKVFFPLSNRVVLTAWTVNATSTHATPTVFTVRNKATNTSILFDGAMLATTGVLTLTQQDRFVPGTAGETIELNVTGGLTGQLTVDVEGGFLPSSVPCVNEYTGAP